MSDVDPTPGGVLADSVVVTRLSAALDGSTAVRTASAVGERLAAGGDRSRILGGLATAGDQLSRWSRDSWLLGPPAEPAVVVVDLRETYTVGPLLAFLDRIAAWVGPRWRGSAPDRTVDRARDAVADAPVRLLSWILLGSVLVPAALAAAAGRTPSGWLLVTAGLALLGTRERRSATALRASPAGRVLAALLVPPDPPTDSFDDRPPRQGAESVDVRWTGREGESRDTGPPGEEPPAERQSDGASSNERPPDDASTNGVPHDEGSSDGGPDAGKRDEV